MYHITGHSFTISKDTSSNWCKSTDYIGFWLDSTQRWLNDLLEANGYLSYETICRALGIRPKAWEITAYKPILKDQIYDHILKFDKVLIDSEKNIWKVTLWEA